MNPAPVANAAPTADPLTLAAERIADALEALAGTAPPARAALQPATSWGWDGRRLHRLRQQPPPLLVGLEAPETRVRAQLDALAAGLPAHDMLLWGARGMGKSALIRRAAHGSAVALVGVAGPDAQTLPALFGVLGAQRTAALVWLDDLSAPPGSDRLRRLRMLLDGGLADRPAHVAVAVTSNHRQLVDADEAAARSDRDREDDRVALADRFGLVLGFHRPSEAAWLAMAKAHCARHGAEFDAEAARRWARNGSVLSGRLAEQFAIDRLQRRHGLVRD